MIKVAVLGAGFMGQTHSKALLKTGRAEIVAVCSVPLESARKLNESTLSGKAECFDDFDEMLASADFDALYVCLPPFAHAGQIEAAARAKKHLFVEKPLGLDAKKAFAMAEVAKKSRVVTQIGYHMRFGTAVQKLKAMIDDGSAGKPTLFDATYQCNALHSAWWRDRRKSGGQMIEQVIHLYDLSTHFLGKPKSVSALTANLCHKKSKGYSSEDTSASIISFAGGAMASITASNCAIPTKWRGMFTVVCENITAEFIDHNSAVFTYHGGKPAEEWWPTGKLPESQQITGDADAYLQESIAFLDAIEGRRKSSPDIAQGARSLELVLAASKSAAGDGKQIKLK